MSADIQNAVNPSEDYQTRGRVNVPLKISASRENIRKSNILDHRSRLSLNRESNGQNCDSVPILRSNSHQNEFQTESPLSMRKSSNKTFNNMFHSVTARTKPGFNGFSLKTNQDSYVVEKNL